MARRRFNAGEALYQAGEPARFAYVIEEGRVARRDPEGDESAIERVDEPGAVLGAAALIGGAHRGTATALTPVTARAIDRDRFLETLQLDAAAEAEVVEMLQRLGLLRATPDFAVDLADPDAPVRRWTSLRLAGADPVFGGQLPAAGLAILALPFSVGRVPGRGEVTPHGRIDLLLADRRPFALSRVHFAIETGKDGLVVRDVGSNLGTLVNGTAIGRRQERDAAPLRPGENRIVAGGEHSPFRFALTVATDD